MGMKIFILRRKLVLKGGICKVRFEMNKFECKISIVENGEI
jgi:hypothetical protein